MLNNNRNKLDYIIVFQMFNIAKFNHLINLDHQPCDVRPYIYHVPQPRPGVNAIIWPFAVQIPRCDGSTGVRGDIMKCRAKTKVDIPLHAYRVSYHNSRKRRDVIDEFAKMKGIFSIFVYRR